MSPGVHKLALAVHLTVSVGWIGAVAAYLALDITNAASEDVAALRAAYVGMESIATSVIVPLALASFVTGLIMSLGSKWGLFRHYWVVISFVLTAVAIVVLVVETQVVRSLADMAVDPATSPEELRAMPSTLPHSIGGAFVLCVVLVLNVYKPQGLTRYGWQKRERGRRDQRASPE